MLVKCLVKFGPEVLEKKLNCEKLTNRKTDEGEQVTRMFHFRFSWANNLTPQTFSLLAFFADLADNKKRGRLMVWGQTYFQRLTLPTVYLKIISWYNITKRKLLYDTKLLSCQYITALQK